MGSGLGTRSLHEHVELKVYPNPASEYVYLELWKRINGTIRIRNILGQVVLMEKISGESKILDITGLKSGLYLLTVESGNFPVNTRKLIIHDDY